MGTAPADAPSHEVFIRIELQWTPVNLLPRPVSALPFQVDVRFAVARNTFPVPPGRHEWAADFELPVDGHLLIAGGHLHDYGVSVRLEEVATGKRILNIESRRDSSGHLLGMPRKLLALRGHGLRLVAGRRYPHVARLHQPASDQVSHALGNLGGAVAATEPRALRALDLLHPDRPLRTEPPCADS